VRILVVDDAALLRTLFTRMATALGHEVVGEADAPGAALALARSLAPDAIVVDGRLADTEVGPLLADLRQAAASSAIFVVAALDEPGLAELARRFGAAGLVRRPFSRAQICEVLDACETAGGR
jgi:two-component system chemotaxis response regulator CheY